MPTRGSGTLSIPASAIAQQGFRVVIARVRDRVADLAPVWDHIRRMIWDSETALFRNQGALQEFPSWAPLSPKYAAWKRRKFGNLKILALSGKLVGQLTGRRSGWYEDRQPQTFALGTNYTDYSGISGRPRSPGDSLRGHDLGGIHAVGRINPHMPARHPLRISMLLQDRIAERLVDYATNTNNEWESPTGRRRRPHTIRYTF